MSYNMRVEDNIIVFEFDHEKVNSIDTRALQGLEEAVDRVNSEEELKGIVLTGTGRYFSGGFDLETFTSFQSREEIIEWFKYEEEVLLKLFTCSKPLVAAVNGHATAAGMIVSMASDYRLVRNHPKIKLGMTEIKIGLSLTPAEGEIMRFGLDTDKNYRDIIFKGELIAPEEAYARGIFDELVEKDVDIVERAKEVVKSYIDTPGRPFILLKLLEKQHAADWIRTGIDEFDWELLADIFTNKEILNTLNMVKEALKG